MALSDSNRSGGTLLPLWAAGFVGLVCVAILALSAWREWASRSDILQNAEVDMANLARSLTQHVEDTIELADATLTGLAGRLEANGTDAAAIAGIQRFLDLRKLTLGRIRGLFVYDETGRWLATTESVDHSGLNNSDRTYFQHHRDVDDGRVLLGRPVKSRVGGQWIITISRRFNHPDGTFAGVVLASIDAAYFAEFYRQFDIGPHGAVALLSTAGTLLARSPDDGSYVGRDMSQTRLIAEQISRSRTGAYDFTSPLDGRQRLSVYRVSERFPVIVLAALAKEDVLVGWRQRALARVGFVLGLTLLIGLIGLNLVRQLLMRQRMAAALAAKEADFRLLAEESSDMVTRIDAGEFVRYASPSAARVLGWSPDQLVGRSALAGVHRDDLARVQQTIAALQRGEIEEAKILYRNRHREKPEIWIETALRVTRHPDTGAIDGVVALSRDMTEHKDLQAKLVVLAASDGLTGLANRRCFDERLDQEWTRARRESTPLSLLIIDIDHFKQLNDQHGHQEGDSCLRAVAGIIAKHGARPADLAARYGGEEFAMLLPNTDANGCEQIGMRICEAIRELESTSDGRSSPWRVTASVGGATCWPNPGIVSSPSSLIEAADRALYSAKNGGRDRVVMAGQIVPWPRAQQA
ncbi:diguanylate cyclase [Bosea sp. F3-2]|uniref:diguanylate cyclase domain-containing protein n=1 Tax=Bosea sp. F3-2 TaxID=2599640 RepID=UPI0011EC7160|nr:diguanylate cyclase [Bosea sp. F3-2]QEL22106.1 diguanylate cyclase [Bosea sp. F3-2]